MRVGKACSKYSDISWRMLSNCVRTIFEGAFNFAFPAVNAVSCVSAIHM